MILEKYPRAKKFFEQHPGMSLDEALTFVENEIIKCEVKK